MSAQLSSSVAGVSRYPALASTLDERPSSDTISPSSRHDAVRRSSSNYDWVGPGGSCRAVNSYHGGLAMEYGRGGTSSYASSPPQRHLHSLSMSPPPSSHSRHLAPLMHRTHPYRQHSNSAPIPSLYSRQSHVDIGRITDQGAAHKGERLSIFNGHHSTCVFPSHSRSGSSPFPRSFNADVEQLLGGARASSHDSDLERKATDRNVEQRVGISRVKGLSAAIEGSYRGAGGRSII